MRKVAGCSRAGCDNVDVQMSEMPGVNGTCHACNLSAIITWWYFLVRVLMVSCSCTWEGKNAQPVFKPACTA